MDKKHCIYMHRNKVTGKVYVGQTVQQDNPSVRWQGGYGYIKQPKFFSDIIKYGWLNFEHNILEKDLTQEQANERENFWIRHFDSYKNGYNSVVENNTLRGRKNMEGLIICLNTNKAYKTLKEASLDTGADPSAISRCYGGQRKSAGMVNGVPGFWILTTSNQQLIDKIKQNYSDAIATKKIIGIETAQVFDSLDEAIAYCGLPVSSSNKARLRNVLKGQTNASFGRDKKLGIKLHWRYM